MTVAAEPLPTILFVATPHALGGSNRSLITVLARLKGRAHRVLAAPGFGPFADLVRAEGLADEWIELPHRPGQRVARVLRLAAGAKLAWWALRNRNRLLAIHANALTGLNLATPAALVSRGRTVAWIHDPVGSEWGRRLGPLLRRLLPRLRLAAVSTTAESVAVANGLCDAGDATIIPNPIDPAEIRTETSRTGAAPLRVGFLGGATKRKGFDLLPDVIEATLDLPITWKLYVFLERTDENASVWRRLERYAHDRVDPAGKRPDVRQVYAELDIVFVPSRAESFCRVAAEAMMNGIPVVGSDIDPLHVLLGANEAGIIVPTGDVAAAAAALRKLVADAELRRSMGDQGVLRAAKYAPEAITEQLAGLYGLNA